MLQGSGALKMLNGPAMSVAREVELKLEASSNCLEQLCSHPHFRAMLKEPAVEQTLNSVYFDTDDFYLLNHGINLRVRQIGDQRLQTLKIVGPSATHFDRTEIEAKISGETPNLDLATQECPELSPIAADVRDAIKPVFTTHVERRSYRIDEGDSEIELALDSGKIVANGSALPIFEIELELKRGRPADLFNLARSISSIVPVQLGLESKAARGYALLDSRDQVAKAEPVILTPFGPVDDAFKTIARSCLHQVLGNAAAVCARNPAAVHQMRVGMRRLRAAISVFSEIVRDDQVDQIKDRLKYYAAELAPARDLEVMIVDVLRPFRRRHPEDKGFSALIGSYTRRRTKAYERAIQAITSDEFRKFTIECAAWIESGPWTDRNVQSNDKGLAGSINVYAAHQIGRRRKKLVRCGRHLAGLKPHEVHQLRIRAKKLRYAAEFFESLYGEGKTAKRSKRFVAAMNDLQEALGAYNDMVVRRTLFTELTAGPQAKKNPAIAFAAGQIVGEQHGIGRQLLKDATKALSKLEGIKAFWKVDESQMEAHAAQLAGVEQSEDATHSELTFQPDVA